VGSIAFLNDQAMYEKGRLLRSTERGKLAVEDANLSGGGVANAFSGAFGSPITAKDAPELHKLLTNMIEDAGDLATRGAKEKYMRIRPFAFYGVATCNTKEQDTLSKNGSYPPATPLSAGPPRWCWLRLIPSGKMKSLSAALSSARAG
jgi:acid phosphatase (class A)